MKTLLKYFLSLTLPVFLVLALTPHTTTGTPQSANPKVSDPSGVVDDLAKDLAPPSTATDDLRTTFSQTGEPGLLWRVAADLQEALTTEQKNRLLAVLERPQNRQLSPRHRPLQPKHRARHRQPLLYDFSLTDEQKEALDTLRTSHREDVRELRLARRDSAMTPDVFRERMQTLRQAHQDEIAEVLTDEQQAKLEARREAVRERPGHRREQRREHREAARAARNEVLDLTDEEQEIVKIHHALSRHIERGQMHKRQHRRKAFRR